jgi:DNA invertase Pin-like site-specific DNA recombinase
MSGGKFVSYLRVSTAKQGRSGLGLEAQRSAVARYLDGGRWEPLAEIVEIESGSCTSRPQLAKALSLCRLHGATLVIAKLDRLSRDAHFLLGLQRARVRFVAADMPSANELVVGVMALVAQEERKLISERTKAALAAARQRGITLGGDRGNLPSVASKGAQASAIVRAQQARERAADLDPIVSELRTSGATFRAIADRLNGLGITAPRGGNWSASQVQRLVRLAA